MSLCSIEEAWGPDFGKGYISSRNIYDNYNTNNNLLPENNTIAQLGGNNDNENNEINLLKIIQTLQLENNELKKNVQIGGGLNLKNFNLTDLTSCIFIGYFLLFVIDTFIELIQYKLN